MKTHSNLRSHQAFTLVELLVVTAVIATLAGLVTAAAQAARSSADKAKEINAARQLTTAYILASSENNGVFLAGYDRTVTDLEWPDGTSVHGPAANRYPFRLAPYFNYQMEGTILVNRNTTQIKLEDTYSVSCYPAFGINYMYVGGDKAANGSITNPDEVTTRSAQGANVLIFASSGSSVAGGGEPVNGYSILTPPKIYGDMWVSGSWQNGGKPENFGHIHPRHGGKAVCAFLDGSVQMLSIEELRDMQRWNLNAAAAKDPNYTVAAAPSPRPGRR